MPILEVDGKRAYQSLAIERYLAKQFNLTGKDDWEDLEIDAIVDTVTDFRTSEVPNVSRYRRISKRLIFILEIGTYYYEFDEAIKAKQTEILFKETIPYYLDRLEAIAKANNGHLAVGKVSTPLIFFRFLNYEFFFIS